MFPLSFWYAVYFICVYDVFNGVFLHNLMWGICMGPCVRVQVNAVCLFLVCVLLHIVCVFRVQFMQVCEYTIVLIAVAFLTLLLLLATQLGCT